MFVRKIFMAAVVAFVAWSACAAGAAALRVTDFSLTPTSAVVGVAGDAAGANGFASGKGTSNANYAQFMANEKQWPVERVIRTNGVDVLHWHHSDVKELAYFFVYPFFDYMVGNAK